MDPFIFPLSIDGMLIDYDPSSSYQNSVNGPAFSYESVNSNYMELEASAAPNSQPNPNLYYHIPDLAANANIDYLYQWNLIYQLNLHFFMIYGFFPFPFPFYFYFPFNSYSWF